MLLPTLFPIALTFRLQANSRVLTACRSSGSNYLRHDFGSPTIRKDSRRTSVHPQLKYYVLQPPLPSNSAIATATTHSSTLSFEVIRIVGKLYVNATHEIRHFDKSKSNDNINSTLPSNSICPSYKLSWWQLQRHFASMLKQISS